MMHERRPYAVWIASALLATTALFHFTGYFAIPPHRTGSPDFFDAALRPLWLFASLHWLLTAAICVLAVRAGPRIAQAILLGSAAAALVEAVLLYQFIGPFIGEAVLATAAMLLIAGAYRAGARVIP